jgi:hypothetical protein
MTIDSSPPTIPQYPHDINNSLAVETNIRFSVDAEAGVLTMPASLKLTPFCETLVRSAPSWCTA